jgi:hypothetical protein
MKQKPGASLLKRLGRKCIGLKKRLIDARLLSCDPNVSLDDTAIMDEEESDPGSQEPDAGADARERKVKFMFPEVTEVQISYRVPKEDKYRFYYTKQNIAFFKRECDLERQPSCADTLTETLVGLFYHYEFQNMPTAPAINFSEKELHRSPLRRSARSIRASNRASRIIRDINTDAINTQEKETALSNTKQD